MELQTSLSFPTGSPIHPLPFTATVEERAVFYALRLGAAHARQIRDLADETGIPGRQVQAIVERLILEYQVPVGTSMRRPYGNYLIDQPEDLKATVELLRVRGISNLVRAAALKRMTLRQYLQEVQAELELERRKIA